MDNIFASTKPLQTLVAPTSGFALPWRIALTASL